MRSINDVLAWNSDRYPIERSNKRYFQSLYVQISPRKQLLCSFLPENCSKHALVGSRWVSGADQQYIMSIFFWNLRYETDRTCCWLFLSFWASISLQSPSRQSFCCFLMFFTKECINFAYLNEKSTWFSSEICFGYFEQIWKDFSDYQVKTN